MPRLPVAGVDRLAGSTGVAACCVALIPLHARYPALLILLLGLGSFFGLTVTPQQHRIFALMPDVATVVLGLNGSAIYVGAGIGAALGGVVVATGGAAWLPVTAVVVAAAAAGALWTIAPERSAGVAVAEPRP